MDKLDRSDKKIAIWLLIGVGMTIIQVLLGGITRLTGSGLSITEWNIITGILPPLNEPAWMVEFDKYRQTPQFQLINFEFTLKDFKFIFFWEWFHRVWARSIGIVFAIGFVWFLLKKSFKKEMVKPLIILFLLGALQGAVGWIMVASGLTGDAVYVKPTRLALHFILALGLLSYTFWFALSFLIDKTQLVQNNKARKLNFLIFVILVFQLMYGALMAGHKAANIAATWPTINGEWLPSQLFKDQPLILNFIDNTILIHFIHRGLAYLMTIIVIIWTIQLKKINGPSIFNFFRYIPFTLVLLQVFLGITSVLSSTSIIPGSWGVFEWMAQLHQFTGMLLLLSIIMLLFLVRNEKL